MIDICSWKDIYDRLDASLKEAFMPLFKNGNE